VRRWFGREPERRPPPPAGAGGPGRPSPGERNSDDGPALRAALDALVRRVKASSGRLPTGAVVEIRDMCDRLGEVLDRVSAAGTTTGPGSYELVTISAVIRDYLPTSIDAYLALPPAFLDSHRNPEGETPDEELAHQLRIMHQGVDDLAMAIYSGDAQRLSIQGRFLDTKFSSSDLDL